MKHAVLFYSGEETILGKKLGINSILGKKLAINLARHGLRREEEWNVNCLIVKANPP